MMFKESVIIIGSLVLCRVVYLIIEQKRNQNKFNIKFEEPTKHESKENLIIEYSREQSSEKKRKLNNTGVEFSRPLLLEKDTQIKNQNISKNCVDDDKNKKKILLNKNKINSSDLITVEEFKKQDNIENKTLRVFVESLVDRCLIVRDNTDFLHLELENTYAVVGEFIYINLTKKSNKITENFIFIEE
jgi:hypothetical protein